MNATYQPVIQPCKPKDSTHALEGMFCMGNDECLSAAAPSLAKEQDGFAENPSWKPYTVNTSTKVLVEYLQKPLI